MRTRLLGTTLVFGLTLSACNPPDQTATATDPVEAMASPMLAEVTPAEVSAPNIVQYDCTPSQLIAATYDNSDATRPKAILLINDVSYEMYAVVAASGARYATEQGIDPEQGMQWHTQGNTARLVSMSLDHTANLDAEKVLFECQQQMLATA